MDNNQPLKSLLSDRDPDELMEQLEEIMHLLVRLLHHEPGQHEAIISLHLLLHEINCTLRRHKHTAHGDR